MEKQGKPLKVQQARRVNLHPTCASVVVPRLTFFHYSFTHPDYSTIKMSKFNKDYLQFQCRLLILTVGESDHVHLFFSEVEDLTRSSTRVQPPGLHHRRIQ
jgi:hypothetical protein